MRSGGMMNDIMSPKPSYTEVKDYSTPLVVPPTVTSIVTQRILLAQKHSSQTRIQSCKPMLRRNTLNSLKSSTKIFNTNSQNMTATTNSATPALLQLDSKMAVGMESLDQWQQMFNANNSDESSMISDEANDDDNSDFDSDDDSITQTDDEEETLVAQAMVKAAFQGMSQTDLDRLIDNTVTNIRKRQSSGFLETDAKKQRNDIPFNSNRRSDIGSVSSSMSTKRIVISRPISTSESLPAFKVPVKQKTNPMKPAMRPDDKLKMILLEASLPAPKLVPYTTIPEFFEEVSTDGIASYDITIVNALRCENVEALREMKLSGKIMFCGNKFGETILHAASRRRSTKVVQFLLDECDFTPRVCCDSGRNPLHDACWTGETNFDVIDMLLDKCPDLLYITDKRGFTPMAYVRKEHWDDWCIYLGQRGAERLKAKEFL